MTIPIDEDEFTADLRHRTESLPFWRRPRRLRRQITTTLVLTALVALSLFGAINYFAADKLLLDGTTAQLANEAQSRASSTEQGVARALRRVSAIAADRGVAAALGNFTEGYASLDNTRLSPQQLAELDRFYEDNVVAPLMALDIVEVTLDDVLPRTDAGRWVQYHYTLPAKAPGSVTMPAGTSTDYDAAMSANDDFLTELSLAFGGGDLLLIDTAGQIVYSTDMSIDLGTSLVDGPYAESNLATLVSDDLERTRAGQAALTDFSVYIPAGGKPVLFAAAAIRDGNKIVGTLAVEIPLERLDDITAPAGAAGGAGLDDVDTYIVSSDLLLQSTPQSWITDPSKYLEGIGDAEVRRITEALGSPVGVQTIDTAPVRAAFEGEPFVGTTRNALNRRTYSSSTLIDAPGVNWAVVTEIPLTVARRPLFGYLLRMGIVAAILLPLAALAGFFLARRLTRPIPIAVEAARDVANGRRHLDLPQLGNNEYGDLGRRLTRMAGTLEQQERALADEFERKRDLLLSVLPADLVRSDGVVTGTGERVEEATVIAVEFDANRTELDDVELGEALATATTIAERLAAERHIDRIRVAADRSLFVAGFGPDGDGADEALDFASALAGELHSVAHAGDLSFTLHVGLSTGPVAAGLLEHGSLTFAAWGEPVRRALAISALSSADEILVDLSTLEAASGDWATGAADAVVDLEDQPIAVRRLTTVPPSEADDAPS